MQPHIDEAWRSLRLADRDSTAFHILRSDPAAHISTINFHAQQAVEKSLKAVLYSRRIEFDRTHDLAKLGMLLKQHGMTLPISEHDLRSLNPFAVTFRYDDSEIELILPQDHVDSLVTIVREWAERQVADASSSDCLEEEHSI